MPSGLNGFQRAMVHQYCEELGVREETRGIEPNRAIWLVKIGEGANESAAEKFKRELSEIVKEKNTAPEQEDQVRTAKRKPPRTHPRSIRRTRCVPGADCEKKTEMTPAPPRPPPPAPPGSPRLEGALLLGQVSRRRRARTSRRGVCLCGGPSVGHGILLRRLPLVEVVLPVPLRALRGRSRRGHSARPAGLLRHRQAFRPVSAAHGGASPAVGPRAPRATRRTHDGPCLRDFRLLPGGLCARFEREEVPVAGGGAAAIYRRGPIDGGDGGSVAQAEPGGEAAQRAGGARAVREPSPPSVRPDGRSVRASAVSTCADQL
eukprot:scaffold6853_cov90-Isochrysis_galbana.AAC.1